LLSSVRFPPRDQLPPGVTIEKLPVLGTTWYDRGPGYWARRLGLFLVMVMVVALASLLIGALLADIKGKSQAGFTGVLIAEIVWSLVIVAFLLVRTVRRWNSVEPARPLSPGRKRAAAMGARLGFLARAGMVIGMAVLVITSMVFFGLYLTVLIFALLPEWLPEHKARLRLAQQLR
jgi:hypothetical protein